MNSISTHANIEGEAVALNYDPPEVDPFPGPNPPEPLRFPVLIQGGFNDELHDFGSELIIESPDFADVNNPIGPDLLWRTNDDGLRPAESGNLIDVGKKIGVPNVGRCF